MKNKLNKLQQLFQKGMNLSAFFVIVLLVVSGTIFSTVNAEGTEKAPKGKFLYSEFDWDSFYEENKTYWNSSCEDAEGQEDSECVYKVLKKQEKFYTKFYKLMAKYEKKGIFDPNTEIYQVLDDLILETLFYELTAGQFSDDNEEYQNDYNDEDITGSVYKIDETDLNDPVADEDYTDEATFDYYATEKDTIKVLVKNLIAYVTECYGVYGSPTKHTTQEGQEYYTCDNGGEQVTLPVRGNKCVDKIRPDAELGFWVYFVSKLEHDESINAISRGVTRLFLGQAVKDVNYDLCVEAGAGYPEKQMYVYNDNPVVSTTKYFDFLKENRFFDARPHLQGKFKEKVLDPLGAKCMTKELCGDKSVEALGGYDDDEIRAEIIEIRLEIIADIIDILNNYGYEISYYATDPYAYTTIENQDAARKSFYWPIGSDETEERNGVIYADKEPAYTEIISQYGDRENPSTGALEFHYGIDIKGEAGVTNVVAVYEGTVLSIVDTCSNDDASCNEGYGNTIILSHSNNDYTVYAYLDSIDPSVTVGSTVDKGQVIGKVGTTGATVDAALHYEIRKGGNSVANAINPSNETNPENPRPAPAAGDFSVHQTSLTREEFVSKLNKYCATNSCSSAFINVFVNNAGLVYDTSISANVNPELVVIRGAKEGMSPGGSTNNYWGIRCYNEGGSSACRSYGSLQEGIRDFANVVSGYETVSQMMSKYAYIGASWFNPGSWSKGGCVYFPYIKEYMSPERAAQVTNICAGPSCSSTGQAGCTRTTDEDQQAYTMWNCRGMTNMRYVAFGL